MTPPGVGGARPLLAEADTQQRSGERRAARGAGEVKGGLRLLGGEEAPSCSPAQGQWETQAGGAWQQTPGISKGGGLGWVRSREAGTEPATKLSWPPC